MNALGQDREEAVHDFVPLFGIYLLGKVHRPLEVSEEDGHLYVRWHPDSDSSGWNKPGLLESQIQALAAEPRILPPPDEHVQLADRL